MKVTKVSHTSEKHKAKMAEQIMNEAIAKAVVEATRIAIQTMAESQAQRVPNTAGPKLGGPTLNSLILTGRLQTCTLNGGHSS